MNASKFRALTLLLVLSLGSMYARLYLADGSAATIDLARPGMPRPETMTDRRLHERLQRRFDRDPAAARVTIEVHDAVVTLGGNVARETDKARIAELALATGGIAAVHNRIYVTHPTPKQSPRSPKESLEVATREGPAQE